MQKAPGRVPRLVSLIGCSLAVQGYTDHRDHEPVPDFVLFSDLGLLRSQQQRSEIFRLLAELAGRSGTAWMR
jgi:hypothetical protein